MIKKELWKREECSFQSVFTSFYFGNYKCMLLILAHLATCQLCELIHGELDLALELDLENESNI